MKELIMKLYGLYLNLLAIVAPRLAGKKGFMLFCRPFRSSITPKQHEFFNSAEKFSREWDGHTIQGFRWGNGPRTVLFLHGWQSHTYRWKAYIESLPRDEYTVYAFDAPGHGLSSGSFLSVPLYSSVIRSFIHEIGEVHAVAAHSLGGFSLLYTCYANPSLPVGRIILMSTPGEATEFTAAFRNALKLSERTLGLVVDYFTEKYKVAPVYFSALRFVAGINTKGLIIHDEDDLEAPYAYAQSLHGTWRTSRMITTRGSGHNLKSPHVVKHVVDFLQEPVEISTQG